MVRFRRNVFSRAPSTTVDDAARQEAIHAQENGKAAQDEYDAVVAALRARRPAQAADVIEESIGGTPAYDGFPDGHYRERAASRKP